MEEEDIECSVARVSLGTVDLIVAFLFCIWGTIQEREEQENKALLRIKANPYT